MEVLFIIFVAAAIIIKQVAKSAAGQQGKKNAGDSVRAASPEPSPAPPRGARRQQTEAERNQLKYSMEYSATPAGVREKKRAQMRNSSQWIAAKRQQDDAGEVHSVRMDSCEGRLESLKVLYEAGILDRKEYEERIARVRAKHAEYERNMR